MLCGESVVKADGVDYLFFIILKEDRNVLATDFLILRFTLTIL